MPAPEPQPSAEALPPQKVALFTVVAVLLALSLLALLAEVALRLASARPLYIEGEAFVTTGDARGYSLRPGYRGLYVGGRLQVGPLGLRGEPGDPAGPLLPERQGGVLLLGDSALFGQGLDDDQTLAARLAELLQQAGRPRPVLNSGVPGYNTELELAALRHLLPLTRPRQVVLIYVTDNDADLRPGLWLRADGTLDLHQNNSLSGRLSRLLTRHVVLYAALRERLPIRQQVLAEGQTRESPFADAAPGWQKSRAALTAMRDLLAEKGVPFAVAGVCLYDHPEGAAQVQRLAAALHLPYATLWCTTDVADWVKHHAVRRTDSHADAKTTLTMAQALLPLVEGTVLAK